MKKWMVVLVLIVASGVAFTAILNDGAYEPVHIPPSTQRTGGDAQKGYEYLTTGDYVKGGMPYNIWILGMGKDKTNFLQRTGKNADISHEYTAVTANNGEVLVAPNCMQCHAQVFDDTLIMGLGNTFIDFTANEKLNVNRLKKVESLLKLTAPNKYRAAKPFIDVAKTITPYLITEIRGVNAADRLAAVLVAHRDPVTFKWNPEAQLEIPEGVIPSDVPPWWLLKKKNAMFYNGFGRGDFGRFLMASNLLTVNDTAESHEVDTHMPDLLAYIYSLEPPKYPGTVNTALANEGEIVFNKKCSGCHGTYGTNETYPNLLIPQAVIQTDSLLYKNNYSSPQFVNWFNQSWFTTGDHPARLEPFMGYIAPPLDGIWVTAPFLHNGSVPTLEALLNSDLRPRYWRRNFNKPEYDYEKLGWKYTKENQAGGKLIYNTDLPGYGNYGHTFGDKLTEQERKAVLEYLKTL
ncbi:c-type cytochrome [Longitalea luteola]|uniref:c-type cytochrome n=1 Tax=Longitalea luteola TaxID=2812563 RepID=UPI001A9669AB|nr:c-type cytochrome [Longitalea luteola]